MAKTSLAPWLSLSLLLGCGGPAAPPAAPTPAGSAAPAAAAGPPSAPHIKGRLSPDDVQRIVRVHLYKVEECYKQGLDRNPKLAGKLVYGFVIGADGKVASIANQGSTIDDPAVIECGKGIFAALQFKPPEDGGTVTVTYPVDLKRR